MISYFTDFFLIYVFQFSWTVNPKCLLRRTTRIRVTSTGITISLCSPGFVSELHVSYCSCTHTGWANILLRDKLQSKRVSYILNFSHV